MKSGLTWVLALIGLLQTVPTSAAESLDVQVRYGHYYTTWVVNADGTAVEYREWSMTVLKEAAVEWAKRASVDFSTSAQAIENVVAHTIKADGRRIDAPKDNYQIEINRGKAKGSPVYSDRTTLTVVFPDVAVGDTVVFSYRLAQTEPLFPGHFSIAQVFPRHIAYDDVRVHIDYPAQHWVQYEAREMTENDKAEKDGRKHIEWRYTNPQPQKNQRRNYSVYDPDKEVGFAFSTFRTYAEIASAYGARALSKVDKSERIQKLAAEIVGDKKAQGDQARALYEWVSTNITYAGNCIGIGAVVPRDVSFVLDNRMGDCKDHATLLQALLSVRGIQSTQALINASNIHRLPRIPTVSAVNHVINYIPSLNLYIDSTADWVPFGMLPFQDQGKPVLLVEGFKEGLKTPVPAFGDNQQTTRSVLKVADDGSVTGTIEVLQKGQGAAQTRAWARKLTKDRESDLIRDMFRGQGMIGSGKLEKDDPSALIDRYRYKTSITLEKFIKVPGAGAFHIYPLTNSYSILNAVQPAMQMEEESEAACWSNMLTEEYTIEMPKKIRILSVPDDVKIANSFLSYDASYKLKGNVLTAKRTFKDQVKGNVCSPEMLGEYRKFAEKVVDNLKTQVLYK
jgi:transglutaminase-like putative cysteine protease